MAVHRMGVCVGKTDKEIWQMFLEAYPDQDERYLREIHNRWVRVLKESGYRGR